MLRVGIGTLVFAATTALSVHIAYAQTSPVQYRTPNIINVAGSTQATLGGQTFVNQGILGMGRIAAGTRDFNNDTFGAFSGMDIDLSTWRKTATGYTGTLFGLPDRGPNGVGAVTFSDYAARLNTFSMSFTPYTGTANLPVATSSQNQLTLTQTGGFFLRDFNGNVTTGFDPGTGSASVITQNGIQLPGQSVGAAAGKISLDAEGVRFLRDKSFYVSDEYGDNVYYFDATGRLQGVIRPPAALLPRDTTGQLSYSSLVDPATGRRPNQGLEGLAITPDGKKLVTLAQSATIQDSTGSQQTRLNTRLMIYDITGSKTPTAPVATYVLQLPTLTQDGGGGNPNRTAAQSEILALNDNQFLVLSRDGNGLGQANLNPVFKSVLLIDTAGATNIAGSTFETTNTPLSPGGVLNSTIRPVQQAELVNMLNATQLAKFGSNLNNITPTRLTLGEKWEGMALAPVLEENTPQDFFLFVGNDNDFLSTTCRVNNQDCSQAVDSDAHVMIYRLSLPTYVDPEYYAAMVRGGPVMLATLSQAGLAVADANSTNVAAHLSAVRRAGWAQPGFSGWVSGVYAKNDWDDFTLPGVKAKTDGFHGTLGVDYGVSESFSVGLILGYGDHDAKADPGYSAKAKGYSYGATLRYNLGGLFVDGSYARGDIDVDRITRPAAYGLTASGATDARSDTALVEAGYIMNWGNAKIGPVAHYTYTKVIYDTFTETGAAGGNLAVPQHSAYSSVIGLGAEASFEYQGVMPTLQASYNLQNRDEPREVALKLNSATAAMATQSVTVPNTKHDFLSLGAGLQGLVGKALWHVGYTAEFGRTDRMGHVVTAGVGFQF